MKFIDEKLEQYCVSYSTTPSALCDELEVYTKKNVEMSQMLTGRMEASLLGFLIRSTGAKTILEFGTYTGYSALAMAEQLPIDGKIYTCDIDPVNTKIAQSFWDRSEHGKKIQSMLGPGLESMTKINGNIDLVFIDADKTNYLNYLKESLKLLSPKGVVAIDNVLWSGKVLEKASDDSTKAIQEVNAFIKSQDNLYGTLLPVRDGLFLVLKR
jgi:caffeoyl-CoA O-methyltransferase